MTLTLATKYMPATNTRGARIKVTPAIGKTFSIPYPYELSGQCCHGAAVREWLNKFGYADQWVEFVVGDNIGGGYVYIQSTSGTVKI